MALQNKEGIPKQLLFSQLKKLYFDDMTTQLKLHTIDTDKTVLKLFAYLDDIDICDIQSKHLKKKFRWMNENEYSISYMNKAYFTLNKIFKYSIKNKYTKHNPMCEFERIKRPNEVIQDKVNFWTLEEFQTFIKVVDNPLYYSLFSFLYYSGCRCGEALALTWDEIDFNTNTFDIHKTLYKRAGIALLTPPKTSHSYRKRQMPNVLVSIMQNWKNIHNSLYSLGEAKIIFGGNDYLSATTIRRHFYQYQKMAKIKKIKIHELRHSHVSYLTNMGAHPQDVAYRIGDTMEQIQKTYSHFFPTREKDLMKFFDENEAIQDYQKCFY